MTLPEVMWLLDAEQIRSVAGRGVSPALLDEFEEFKKREGLI